MTIILTMYPSISINDPDFKTKLINNFKTDGLVVINDVLSDQECLDSMNGILNDFQLLGTGIDINNVKKTWIDHNLPPQTRPGLFQALMSNCDKVWKLRSNDNVRKIFEILYSNFRDKEVNDFIVSGDGINVRPGTIGTYYKGDDWAHLDQTIRGNIYKCIQGQMVLTNTTACFVASPKSHLIFEKILDKLNCNTNTNWLKFSENDIEIVKQMILDSGGKYQIPILAKRGSFVVWASTVVHAAKLQDKAEHPGVGINKYDGWRGVVYICYRPKEEFTQAEIKKRIKAYEENRVVNHWSVKLFGKKPGSRFMYMTKKHDEIEKMINKPELVYEKIGIPILSDKQKKLIGI
jgi:hypothetical protein